MPDKNTEASDLFARFTAKFDALHQR
jgi:hypothetical protein